MVIIVDKKKQPVKFFFGSQYETEINEIASHFVRLLYMVNGEKKTHFQEQLVVLHPLALQFYNGFSAFQMKLDFLNIAYIKRVYLNLMLIYRVASSTPFGLWMVKNSEYVEKIILHFSVLHFCLLAFLR